MRIPVSSPILGKNASKYLWECVDTKWISSGGKFVKLFEEKFAKYLGVKYAISVSSGTNAMHTALAALDIGVGDEVIVPDMTYVAAIYTPMYLGAKPVLIDARKDTWNIDERLIEAKITKQTKAIMPVHMYGLPANMAEIMRLARKYKLVVIEDAAEALGAEYKGKKAGTMGDIGCFSLYANKTVTTGEGGMVVTNSKNLADKIRSIKNMGESPNKRFWHTRRGYTYRMSNLQAAVGLAQLEQVEELMAKKVHIGQMYNKLLKDIPGLQLPAETEGSKNIYWMYSLVPEKHSSNLRAMLKETGIETREFFTPLHRQPMMKPGKDKYPVADYLSKRGFYIPSGPDLTDRQIRYVCDTIRESYEKVQSLRPQNQTISRSRFGTRSRGVSLKD